MKCIVSNVLSRDILSGATPLGLCDALLGYWLDERSETLTNES